VPAQLRKDFKDMHDEFGPYLSADEHKPSVSVLSFYDQHAIGGKQPTRINVKGLSSLLAGLRGLHFR
jgi:hypothetical protein